MKNNTNAIEVNKLFHHMFEEHGLTLLESELREIENAVDQQREARRRLEL